MRRAIFPGSFDPLTLGHCEIIKKATQVFDQVIVSVGNNSEKKYIFVRSTKVASTSLMSAIIKAETKNEKILRIGNSNKVQFEIIEKTF